MDTAYNKVKEIFEEKMQEIYDEIGFVSGPDMEKVEGAFLHDLTEIIGREQTREIGINEFMERVPSDQKGNYILIESDGQEHDIAVFPVVLGNNSMNCELCDGHQEWEAKSFIGTGDTREPKYCFPHYRQINYHSEFRRVRGPL